MQSGESNRPPWQRYRPRGTGDLLDRSLVLLRQRFGQIFAISVVLQLFEYLAGAWTGQGVTLSSQLAELSRSFTDLSDTGVLRSVALAGITMLVSELTLAVAALFVAADVDGGAADARGVARQLLRRLPALLWTLFMLGAVTLGALLGGSAALAGLIALGMTLDPIAVAALWAVGLLLGLTLATVVMLRVALTPVVVVIEGSQGLAAILRSWRLVGRATGPGLMNNSRWRIALIYTVILGIGWGVAALASLPAVALQFAGLLGPEGAAASAAAPLLLRVLLELLEVAGQAAVGPFGALALAYFYFDLRARHEGLDLLLSARFVRARRLAAGA